MEKYASMWRGETPVERQDHAVDMWNAMAGGAIPKEDVSSRLEKLFPQTHTKEAAADPLSNPEYRKFLEEQSAPELSAKEKSYLNRATLKGALKGGAGALGVGALGGAGAGVLGVGAAGALASGLAGRMISPPAGAYARGALHGAGHGAKLMAQNPLLMGGSMALGGLLANRAANRRLQKLKEQKKEASIGNLTAKQLIGGASLLGGGALAARSLSRSKSDGRQALSPERSLERRGPAGAQELIQYRPGGDTKGQRDAATSLVAYRHKRMQGDKRSKLKEKMLKGEKAYADAAAKHRLLAAGAAGIGGGAIAGLAARAAARKYGLS